MSLLSLTKKITGTDKKVKKSAPKKTAKKVVKKTADKTSVLAGQIGLVEIVSERSMRQQEIGVAIFRVLPSATKRDIARAVSEKYGVGVKDVRTTRYLPKKRRRGRTVGKTNAWKKAYVSVDDIGALNTGP